MKNKIEKRFGPIMKNGKMLNLEILSNRNSYTKKYKDTIENTTKDIYYNIYLSDKINLYNTTSLEKDIKQLSELFTEYISFLGLDKELFGYITLYSNNNILCKDTKIKINKAGLSDIFKSKNYCVNKQDEDLYLHTYLVKVNINQIKELSSIIIGMDFNVGEGLQIDAYYYSLKKGIFLNLYDDRGFYIYTDNRKIIERFIAHYRLEYSII